jgi:signal transduction histidine kinase
MSLLLLTPGALTPLFGVSWLRGSLTALGGLVLLWAAGTDLPRGRARVVQYLAIAPQAWFGLEYLRMGVFSAGALLMLLVLGIFVAANTRPAGVEHGPRPDLAGLTLAAAQASQGLDLIFRPGAAVAVPEIAGVSPGALGGVFLASGLLVIAAQSLQGTRGQLPSPAFWLIHAGSGLSLLALWVGQAMLLDPGYWVLGAAVVLRGLGLALLPLISERILRLDTRSLQPQLALALVTAALAPLMTVLTVVVDAGLMGGTLQARQLAFGVMLVTSIVCGGLGAWLAGRLSRPINALMKGVDSIAAGERSVSLGSNGPGEVQRLASAVRTMADSLDARGAERARLAREAAILHERQRLARDLHDSVSQALFGITLATYNALQHWDDRPAQARLRVEQAQLLAKTAQAEMRALIFELRPDQLETDGLVKALEMQTEALAQRREFAVDVTLCDEPDVDLNVKEVFYRVAQEAMHNALKHARPQRLALALTHAEDRVTLLITDDGRGFDADRPYPGHLGLRSMRERAALIGADLHIESGPSGSLVRLAYPIGPASALK